MHYYAIKHAKERTKKTTNRSRGPTQHFLNTTAAQNTNNKPQQQHNIPLCSHSYRIFLFHSIQIITNHHV